MAVLIEKSDASLLSYGRTSEGNRLSSASKTSRAEAKAAAASSFVASSGSPG